MDTDLKWHYRFLALAEHISSWSKDPSTKVGAVLTQSGNLVVGLGYNGFARGVHDTDTRLENRDLKYKLVVHAELNAILMAGEKAKGATLYVTPSFMAPPICHECCKAAIQAGIVRVVGYTPTFATEEAAQRAERWKESIAVSREMCLEAGVGWLSLPKAGPAV